jgi:uncharacterized coiled-coil DUF342 family protein
LNRVYIIIIFVIVLAFFLVIAFGGSENAGTMMGTASTVSSLILSVIAIVLSLMDVAGQRQSMVDLKETADKLHESNESSAALIQDLTAKMVELQGMKEQMTSAVAESEEWRTELISEIKELKEKGKIENDDLDQLFEKANKRYSLNVEKLAADMPILSKSEIESLAKKTMFDEYLKKNKG